MIQKYLETSGRIRTVSQLLKYCNKRLIIVEGNKIFQSDLKVIFSSRVTSRNMDQKPLIIHLSQNKNGEAHACCLLPFICLSKKGNKLFCQFCCKDYNKQYFTMHKCVLNKCKKCCRILVDTFNCNILDYNSKAKCQSVLKKDCDVICKCNQKFNNTLCYQTHKQFESKLCTPFLKCDTCEKTFRKRKVHICYQTFCRKCFSVHEKKTECKLKPIPVKKNQSGGYYMILSLWHREQPKYVLSTYCCLKDKSTNNNVRLKILTDENSASLIYHNIISRLNSTYSNYVVCDQESFIFIQNLYLSLETNGCQIQNSAHFKWNKLNYINLCGFLTEPDAILSIRSKYFMPESNSALHIFPSKLLDAKSGDILELFPHDFDINKIFGSSRCHFELLKEDHAKLPNILKKLSNQVNYIIQFLAGQRINLYINCIQKIQNLWLEISQQAENIKINNCYKQQTEKPHFYNLFESSSLANLGWNL